MTTDLSIQAITFDLGNVLIKVDHFRFCRRLAALAGKTPAAIFSAVFESELEPGYDTGRLSSQEFYQQLTSHFQVDLPYETFCRWWSDIFEPMAGMEEVVRSLKARFPLYLLSNTNPLHFEDIRERFPLVHHCRRFILSYEVGHRKPEPGIYQALLQEIGLPPAQCLFIDDKLPFVEAARNQGLVSWQFTSPADLIRDLRQHGLA